MWLPSVRLENAPLVTELDNLLRRHNRSQSVLFHRLEPLVDQPQLAKVRVYIPQGTYGWRDTIALRLHRPNTFVFLNYSPESHAVRASLPNLCPFTNRVRALVAADMQDGCPADVLLTMEKPFSVRIYQYR